MRPTSTPEGSDESRDPEPAEELDLGDEVPTDDGVVGGFGEGPTQDETDRG